MGTGPAIYLASTFKPRAIFLISPYTSIRNVVKHVAGSLVQYLVADRFPNIQLIDKIQCNLLNLNFRPCFIYPRIKGHFNTLFALLRINVVMQIRVHDTFTP